METMSLLGPKVWDIFTKNNKDLENINIFKSKVKFWKPENQV